MVENVEVLRNAEAGKDIYVIGSGKSLDYFPDSFWEGKIIITVNYAYLKVRCKYGITHHHTLVQGMIDSGRIENVITSYEESCIAGFHVHNFGGDYYYYNHPNQTFTVITLHTFDQPGFLTAGGTIVTEAIHLAYLLGAKNIILCAVDGGSLDGEMNFTGDITNTSVFHPQNVAHQLERISNFIRSRGIPVVSILPFINMALEGHKFESLPDKIPIV